MLGNWVRPKNVPYPSVWIRFDGKREINGKIPKFWIQDIPEDMFEDAILFMSKSYVYEEPLCKYLNIANDPTAMEEGKEAWRMILSAKLGLICFMENPDKDGKPIIAGLNMTCCRTRDEPKLDFTNEKLQTMMDTVMYLCTPKNTFDLVGVDVYLNAAGMSVLPEFRGQGIGDQLLAARIPLCKAVGIKVTFTIFSAVSSQKLGERAGYKVSSEITYEDLRKVDPRFSYKGIEETCKCMKLLYKLME